MSGPERIWWLNIILASALLLLLEKCINATEIDNDAINSTPQTTKSNNNNNNDNYEMIDVMQRGGNKNLQVPTGQTTRILTSGEVDDNFWLKHLGEDFKYAIHLQVDDDQYNGIYNMTENGSNYEVKHEYYKNDIPVDGNRSETQKEPEIRYENHVNNESNSVYNKTSINAAQVQQEQAVKDYEDANTLSERSRSVKKKHASKKRNENHMTQNNKYTKPTKTHNINIRISHKQQQQQNRQEQQQQEQQKQQETQTQKQEDTDNASNQKNNESNPETSSIVVTLPNDDKTIQHLADEDKPVVVKMPPVIYHQGPTYTEYAPEEHTNHTAHHQHQHQHQHQHHHTAQIPPIQNQYPPITHPKQQQIHFENTDFTQYNPNPIHTHSPSMTSLAPTQYYNPNLLNEPTVYRSDTLYTSSQTAAAVAAAATAATGPNSIHMPNSKNQLQKSADSIHFILRKPSTPYNAQPTHNQMPLENTF